MRHAALILAVSVPSSLCAQPETEGGTPFDEIVTVSSRIPQPRHEIATPVTVISGDEIVAQGDLSLIEVLRTTTSVGVSNAGGAGKVSALRIRGEESYRTRVRIDGIEISDPSSTQVAPHVEHLLTTREIGRVEVLRGAQGFSYGADSGGVVNIMSRRGEGELDGNLGLELGANGLRRLDAGFSGSGDSADFLLYAGNVESDGFNAHEDDIVPADDDGYENTTWHSKLGWAATERLRLEFVGRGMDARNEYDRCGFPTADACVGTIRQAAYRLGADWARGDLSGMFALSGTETERADFAEASHAFATEGELERLEYSGSVAVGAAARLVFGADFEREEVLPKGGERLLHEQDAAYVEYQGTFAGNVHVSLGVRRDESDGFGSHNSVRTAVAYVAERASGARLKYRASYGTGFRAPSLSEIAYNAGPFAAPPAASTLLREEASRGLDLGIELLTAGGAYYEIGVFEQTIDDEIYFDLAFFSGYLQSDGRSESRGVELAFDVPVASHWALVGNALFNDTETVDELARIRRPRRMANLGMRHASTNGRWTVRTNLRRSEGAVDELFGIGRVPLVDYSVLDVAAAYAFDERVELFGRIENALDESYQELVGFDTAGVSVYAGVRLKLD